MNTAVFILAGGSGNRLWPLSRKDMPKQFLPVLSNTLSFFQATVSRALKITDASNIYILTQKDYADCIFAQSPQIPKENVFFESQKKNTAPAIAAAMLKVNHLSGDAVSVVLPADHYISDEELFLSTISSAVSLAQENNNIISIGIPPTRPDTAFGYLKYNKDEIQNGIFKCISFKEKPELSQAIELISDGCCLWNSGIFISKISFMISQFQKYLPDVINCAERLKNTSDEKSADKIYSEMPEISVDYGILEKTDSVLLVKGLFGWDDIGSWKALDRLFAKDENGNIIKGKCIPLNSNNCTVISCDKLTVTAGTDNLYIINAPDATFVFSKDASDYMADLPATIEKNGFKNLL